MADVADKYKIHMDICKELNETYIKKNHDYGDSFGKGFKEYGMMMPIIRLEDKFNRFKKLAMGSENQVKDESIRDTLMDLANYALMAVVEMDVMAEEKEPSVTYYSEDVPYITVTCPSTGCDWTKEN